MDEVNYQLVDGLSARLNLLATQTTNKSSQHLLSNLLAVENATGEDVVSILDSIGYQLKDVVTYTVFKQAKFVVWVGGTVINSYLVDLKKAAEIYHYWVNNKRHDDVAICLASS